MKSLGKLTAGAMLRRPLAAALVIAAFSAQAADYFATVLADHPVAYFRLEEASGAGQVDDSSGNVNVGFPNYVLQGDGVTTYPQLGQAGIDSNAVAFATSTGIGQGYIDFPVNSTINPTLGDNITGAPFTAEVWLQATSDSVGKYETPVDDSSDFGQPPPWNNSAGWNLYQTAGPGSTWSYSIRPNPGYVGGGAPVVIGKWTHIVLTYDGTNSTFYADGVQVRKDAVPSYLANNGAEDLILGQGPATGQSPFDGYIDELAIYNYPLSAAQVAAHYAVGTNEIRAIPTPPSFSTEPVSATAFAGVPVTFSSQALGTAPLHYQWVRQGSGPIPGANNNTYTITPSYPADNGAVFFVTVTNTAGVTNSDLATLTVLTNVSIDHSPFSITRRVGSHAAFRVAASGARPLSYQWHCVSNAIDTAISGATADTLWLTNVPATADGNSYYAVVTGPFANASSDPATLSVTARTSTAPVTGYSKVVMADNPVAYWRLDEASDTDTVLDTAGSFDGAYLDPAGTFQFGYATGIPHETDAAIHVTNSATVTIPYALELNPVTGPWSVEFWMQPTSLDPNNFKTPVSFEGNQNFGANLSGWNIYQHVAGVWTWNLYNGGGGGSFTSEFTDNPIVPGTWYHMVLTDDTTNLNWYSNGRLVLALTTAGVGFLPNGINGDPAVAGGPTTLAVRSDGAFGAWDGGLDDVAVYNYVLSLSQIQNHLLNSTHLSVAKSGESLILTWPVGTLQSAPAVNGTYTDVDGASSPWPVTPTGTKFYRVKVQ